MTEQAKGLTHGDSVRQLPFRGNCFNWVLGHILESCSQMLGILGYEPFFGEAEAALYKRGSEPITDGETAVYGIWKLLLVDLEEQVGNGETAVIIHRLAESIDEDELREGFLTAVSVQPILKKATYSI